MAISTHRNSLICVLLFFLFVHLNSLSAQRDLPDIIDIGIVNSLVIVSDIAINGDNSIQFGSPVESNAIGRFEYVNIPACNVVQGMISHYKVVFRKNNTSYITRFYFSIRNDTAFVSNDNNTIVNNSIINETSFLKYRVTSTGSSLSIQLLSGNNISYRVFRVCNYSGNTRLAMDQPINTFIYPNPSTDNIFLEYTLDKESQVDISLQQLNGQQLARFTNHPAYKGKHQQQIPIQQYPPGVFLIKIQIDQQLNKVLKFVKTD